MLVEVAKGLAELRHHAAFVGGAAIGVYLDSHAQVDIRVTDDVDCVIEAMLGPMHNVEKRLRSLGFSHDNSEDAPICRWRYRGIKVDIMPVGQEYGFSNRWYAEGMRERISRVVDEVEIQVFPLPLFLACKFEAFLDRGKEDYMASHDWEDIVTLLAEAEPFESAIVACSNEVRDFLRERAQAALTQPYWEELVYAQLDRDGQEDTRFAKVGQRLERLSRM